MIRRIGSHARSMRSVAIAALAIAALGQGTPRAQPAKTPAPQGGPAAAGAAKTTPERIRAAAQVDAATIQANMATSKDWPTVGADYAETRFSKLSEINAGNVK